MFVAQIILNGIVLGTQVLLLAVPLFLVYSVSKIYHLALGTIGVSVAYGVYFGLSQGWGWMWASLLGVVVAIVLSLISFWLLESSAKNQEELFGLMISFALYLVLQSVISIIFGTDGKFLVDTVLPVVTVGPLYITTTGLITIITGFALAVLAAVVIVKTPWGRAVRSVSENFSLASSLAISAPRVRFYTYIIASLLAGFVVVLTAVNTNLTPHLGFNLLILGFVALLIGGVKNIKGALIASYLIAIIPELLVSVSGGAWQLTASWKMFIVFILATALLLWRPTGLLTKEERAT